jgi:hypothetical protein
MSRPVKTATSFLSLIALLLASLSAGCGDAASDGSSSSGLAAMSESAPATASYAALNKLLPAVGEPLPAIVGSTLDGERIDNDSLHGRTVLLNLWFVH